MRNLNVAVFATSLLAVAPNASAKPSPAAPRNTLEDPRLSSPLTSTPNPTHEFDSEFAGQIRQAALCVLTRGERAEVGPLEVYKFSFRDGKTEYGMTAYNGNERLRGKDPEDGVGITVKMLAGGELSGDVSTIVTDNGLDGSPDYAALLGEGTLMPHDLSRKEDYDAVRGLLRHTIKLTLAECARIDTAPVPKPKDPSEKRGKKA